MNIKAYGLQEIKKELQHLTAPQVAEVALRLARYKKENKELLAYLLFESQDEAGYIEKVKAESGFMFSQVYGNGYQQNKMIRKALRLVNKHVKFMASKTAEVELLINFCQNYVQYADGRTSHKPLRQVFVRQIEKIVKSIGKLHEDLQFDFAQEYESLLILAGTNLRWFDKDGYKL